MAEITPRRTGELVRGVFELLLDSEDGQQASDVLRRLESRVPPTPFENTTYLKHPNTRRYEKIVRFSSIGPVKAGWLVKNKGRWSLTQDGRAAYATFTDPEAFSLEARRLYRVWRKTQPNDEDEPENEGAATSASALEEAEEAAWTEIRDYLTSMPPYDFQRLVAVLLGAMGYHVQWVAPPGPDKGIDIVAHSDPLGTVNPRIKVQVKRRADKTNAAELRSFMAVLGDQDVGIYVGAGGFTTDAEQEARTQEKRRITLLDLDSLVELWIDHFDRVPLEDRLLLPLKPIHFLALPT